jgi:hypothetical protein
MFGDPLHDELMRYSCKGVLQLYSCTVQLLYRYEYSRSYVITVDTVMVLVPS